MFLILSCNCLCPIHWSQVLNPEWRCSWSSADRRCSNYIWVMNNFFAYQGESYIGGLRVSYPSFHLMWGLKLVELFTHCGLTMSSGITELCQPVMTLFWLHMMVSPGHNELTEMTNFCSFIHTIKENITHMCNEISHISRSHSGYGLSQWEKASQSNASSHWLRPYQELSLMWFFQLYKM